MENELRPVVYPLADVALRRLAAKSIRKAAETLEGTDDPHWSEVLVETAWHLDQFDQAGPYESEFTYLYRE